MTMPAKTSIWVILSASAAMLVLVLTVATQLVSVASGLQKVSDGQDNLARELHQTAASLVDDQKRIARDTAIAQWTEKTADTGFKAGFLGASLQIGGTVADVAFPGRHNANVFSAPEAACAPLVAECLDHPSSTDLPPGYDALAILLK